MHSGFGLTIAQKGALLALVVGVMELLFVSLLYYELQLEESCAVLKTAVKDNYLRTQDMARSFYEGHESLSRWAREGQNPQDEKDYRDYSKRANDDLQVLKKYFESDKRNVQVFPPLLAAVSQWSYLSADFVSRLNAIPAAERVPSNVPENVYALRRQVQLLAVEFIKVQLKDLESVIEKEDKYRNSMQFVVWGGLLLNILLAVGMGVFFAKNISSRLVIMAANTLRLRERKPLHPAFVGKDEIALLDASFHDMANAISQNEEEKRAYIALFRDELAKPLNHVRSTLAELETKFEGPPLKIVSTADRNLSRLVTIIDDLTEVDNPSAANMKLNKTTISVVDLVERSIESVNTFASKYGVEIKSDCADCQINADGDRLVQVLVNLLSNASKFSPKGSVVKISSEIKDKTIKLSVSDQGRGIPASKIDSIFSKFQQAESSDGKRGFGTGLGLNICKQIVELHSGTIGVESEEGKGSKFWLEIPIAVAEERK